MNFLFKYYQCVFLALAFSFLATTSQAQKDSSIVDNSFATEEKLMTTKWKYVHSTIKGSTTKVHESIEAYDHFIHLSYDNQFEQYLNGVYNKGVWQISPDGAELYFKFGSVRWWRIVDYQADNIVLEYRPKYKAARYFYFARVEDEEAPFEKPPLELPTVDIKDDAPQKGKFLAGIFKRKKERKERLPKGKKTYDPKKEKEKEEEIEIPYVEIVLAGGGYYGGIDPVFKNYIQIKSTGRLIHEFHSLQRGEVKTKKDIPKEDLLSLAEFIKNKNFFDFQDYYDCETTVCNKRKEESPTPIPLRLYVKYGTMYKMVTVSIWEDDKNGQYRFVDYPEDLKIIVDNILLLAQP